MFNLYKRCADHCNISRDAAWVARVINDDPHRNAHRFLQLRKLDLAQQKKSAILDQEQQARRIAYTQCAKLAARCDGIPVSRKFCLPSQRSSCKDRQLSQLYCLDYKVQRQMLRYAANAVPYEKFFVAQQC
jgi:hypothetical protein